MKNQLIPPPDLAPPSVRHLSSEEKVGLWEQMVADGDGIVIEGLRQRLGPDADINAAFLEWLDRRDAEHDLAMRRMITEMRRRERAYAG